MLHAMGAMGTVFGLVGSVFAVAGVGMAVALVRRLAGRRRALAHGLPAEARCLETYTTRNGDGPSHRHTILGFRTQDGREVRIDDTTSRTVVVGDVVTVRYLPERPERAAVVGSGGAGTWVGAFSAIAFCAVFTAMGLVFAVMGFTAASSGM